LLWGKFSFQVKIKTWPSFFEKRVIIFSFPKKRIKKNALSKINFFLFTKKKIDACLCMYVVISVYNRLFEFFVPFLKVFVVIISTLNEFSGSSRFFFCFSATI